MKKINYFILSMMSLLLTTATFAQTTVLGYFPSYRATSVVDYTKLTDIVFAFINPNTNGTLNQSNTDATFGFDYNKFVTIKSGAQANAVNLWIALGGADASELRSARLKSVCSNSTYRAALVNDLVNFAITHGCVGIDIDWEFPKDAAARTAHYDLINDLRTKINASSNPSLKISVAVGGEYKFTVNHLQYIDSRVISNSALVDKFNIMAYDFPSTYNVNHSSYADAQGSMEGWNQVMGVPYSKMLLGIPFYGRNTWTEIEYNALGGSAATNYTADSYGGYYYNGKTTIEAKMDLVATKGAKGILIWDLGQDRTDQYSLLSAIATKAATLCAVPKPNLGPDKGVCSGNSTTLDPGISTASGRTFAWYKDNVLQSGQTGTTLSVNSAGTYKVEITQSGCTREDEIVIVSGSSVTTTGAQGCNNVSLSLSVNNPDGGKTYKWYDQASGGTQLGTGTTYSAIFANTTTVYVEEASTGVTTYTSDPSTVPDTKFYAWAGGQYTYRCAQMLVVEQDLTIKSLRAMIKKLTGCTFSVKVIRSDNLTAVTEVGPFTKAAQASAQSWEQEYFDFSANITLTPGSYFIYLEPASGHEANYAIINDLTQESAQAGVYTLKGSTFQRSSTVDFNTGDEGQSWWTAYGPFLNWEIETGANASCGRTAATATVQQCGPPSVTINSPTAGQDVQIPNSLSLAADVSDEGTVSSVVFEIYKGGSLVTTVTATHSGSSYTATWTPTVAGTDYSFKVTATDNDNNTTTQSVAFTVSTSIGVSLVEGQGVSLYPNPSNSDFNISIDGAQGFVLSVYSLSGKLLETTNVSGSQASFGADLAAGAYVVKAVSSTGTFQAQVVKN